MWNTLIYLLAFVCNSIDQSKSPQLQCSSIDSGWGYDLFYVCSTGRSAYAYEYTFKWISTRLHTSLAWNKASSRCEKTTKNYSKVFAKCNIQHIYLNVVQRLNIELNLPIPATRIAFQLYTRLNNVHYRVVWVVVESSSTFYTLKREENVGTRI